VTGVPNIGSPPGDGPGAPCLVSPKARAAAVGGLPAPGPVAGAHSARTSTDHVDL